MAIVALAGIVAADASALAGDRLSPAIEAGDNYLSQDKLPEAIAAYLQAVKSAPADAVAHQRLGRAYALSQKLNESVDELRAAINLDPTFTQAHIDLGWVYGMRHQFRSAANEERAALVLDPRNTSALMDLGVALTAQQDYDNAKTAFTREINLDPANVAGHLNMASLLGRQGDYQHSAEYYRRALTMDSENAGAHIGLGSALGRMGDIQGELREFRAATGVAPESAIAHGKLGWALYRSGDWTGALFEGVAANGLRLQQSSSNFMSSLLTAWAALFIVFGILFGAVFSGSRFKPQTGETIAKSFFLVFYKEKPGRFVVTDRRLVFVPEAFSQWFGATRLSLDLVDIESIHHTSSTMGGGHLAVLASNGTVYHFAMPVLVLEPLMIELKKLQLSGGHELPEDVEQKATAAGTAASNDTAADTTPPQEQSLFADNQEGVELVEILHIEPTDPDSTPAKPEDKVPAATKEETGAAEDEAAKSETADEKTDQSAKDSPAKDQTEPEA